MTLTIYQIVQFNKTISSSTFFFTRQCLFGVMNTQCANHVSFHLDFYYLLFCLPNSSNSKKRGVHAHIYCFLSVSIWHDTRVVRVEWRVIRARDWAMTGLVYLTADNAILINESNWCDIICNLLLLFLTRVCFV